MKDLLRPEQVWQLTGLGLDGPFPPLASLDVVGHNLPVRTSSFIGPERDLAQLVACVRENRLVTYAAHPKGSPGGPATLKPPQHRVSTTQVCRHGRRRLGGLGSLLMDATVVIEREVRELVRRRGLDPATDTAAVRRLVDEVVADYDERTLSSTLPPVADRVRTTREVYDSVAGFGPLQRYLDDSTVEEIWINERLTAG